jgi:hypothetical protein
MKKKDGEGIILQKIFAESIKEPVKQQKMSASILLNGAV